MVRCPEERNFKKMKTEQLKREHDQFQVAVEKTHASAVQVKYRADALRAANHYDPHTIRY